MKFSVYFMVVLLFVTYPVNGNFLSSLQHVGHSIKQAISNSFYGMGRAVGIVGSNSQHRIRVAISQPNHIDKMTLSKYLPKTKFEKKLLKKANFKNKPKKKLRKQKINETVLFEIKRQEEPTSWPLLRHQEKSPIEMTVSNFIPRDSDSFVDKGKEHEQTNRIIADAQLYPVSHKIVNSKEEKHKFPVEVRNYTSYFRKPNYPVRPYIHQEHVKLLPNQLKTNENINKEEEIGNNFLLQGDDYSQNSLPESYEDSKEINGKINGKPMPYALTEEHFDSYRRRENKDLVKKFDNVLNNDYNSDYQDGNYGIQRENLKGRDERSFPNKNHTSTKNSSK